MKCSSCGEREGIVSLTQIVEGDVRTVSLCAKCAAEKGIETGVGIAETPLGGFLAALGESSDPDAPPPTGLEAACPSCGATLRDFRETGRLGCSECYSAFDTPLRELLRRLHGSTHHSGMRYSGGEPGPAPSVLPDPAVRELREELRRAIEAEQFELAAQLRDRLRERE